MNAKRDNTRVFLLHGDESYLIKQEQARIVKEVFPAGVENIGMNMDTFSGRNFDIENVINACETLPFMSDKRLTVLDDTALFTPVRKTDSDFFADYIPKLPNETVLLFIETAVDKRSRLYKAVKETGRVSELNTPPEKDLIGWTAGLFKEQKKEISNGCAAYLLRTAAHSMDAVYNEAKKLIAYKGDDKSVTTDDINAVCTKSVEAKIFDLTAAIGSRRADEALELYNNMILLKEPPIMILSMIARQFRLILQCGYLASKRVNADEIASALGLRGFVVRECLGQSKNFKQQTLEAALHDCLETDLKIKTGKMGDRLAVEMLILKYCI